MVSSKNESKRKGDRSGGPDAVLAELKTAFAALEKKGALSPGDVDRFVDLSLKLSREFYAAEDRTTTTSVSSLNNLIDRALSLAKLGYVDQANELLAPDNREFSESPDMQLARALLTVAVKSESAAHQASSVSELDLQAAAMEVINLTYRGELERAISCAHERDWFLSDASATEGLTYAIWSLAMLDRFDEAKQIIEDWKKRHAKEESAKYQLMLRVEARVAYFEKRYDRELSLLQDAYALGKRLQLDAGIAFMEPYLAAAHARCDDSTRAREITERWDGDDPNATSPLNGFRDVALLEIAILAEDYETALSAGQRALEFCDNINNIPIACSVRFNRVLASPREALTEELERYRRAVHHLRIPYHLRRLQVIDYLVSSESTSLRDTRVCVRSRSASTLQPLCRLFSPKVEWMRSDLYWNNVFNQFYIKGRGPFELRQHPILTRITRAVLDQPGFSQQIEETYRAVWEADYNPLTHENKFHVTIHRLRKWLEENGLSETPPLEIRGGSVLFSTTTDVRTISLEGAVSDLSKENVEDLILQTLRVDGVLSPGEMQKKLGARRSRINQALRALVSRGAVTRIGAGRTTRYSVTPPKQ